MEQSGLPRHVTPSASPCKRIISTSDLSIGSSPTTHITSSTTLLSGSGASSTTAALSAVAAFCSTSSAAKAVALALSLPAFATAAVARRAAARARNIVLFVFLIYMFYFSSACQLHAFCRQAASDKVAKFSFYQCLFTVSNTCLSTHTGYLRRSSATHCFSSSS